MTKRTPSTTRRNQITATPTSSGAPPTTPLEERVIAFAEQLGRLAGTVHGRTAGWMDGDSLKQELARVRDGAADLLQRLTGDATPVANKQATAGAAARPDKGRSGGTVDAPGKKHRPLMRSDPDASHLDSQAAKVRAARTMVKTNRRRGRG